jgi:hypothetical protein
VWSLLVRSLEPIPILWAAVPPFQSGPKNVLLTGLGFEMRTSGKPAQEESMERPEPSFGPMLASRVLQEERMLSRYDEKRFPRTTHLVPRMAFCRLGSRGADGDSPHVNLATVVPRCPIVSRNAHFGQVRNGKLFRSWSANRATARDSGQKDRKDPCELGHVQRA